MTLSTVLHEAAHNLGPAHEYRVDGKTDDQVFSGALAEKTRDEWATAGTAWAGLLGVIQERWLRAPNASFVYSIQP